MANPNSYDIIASHYGSYVQFRGVTEKGRGFLFQLSDAYEIRPGCLVDISARMADAIIKASKNEGLNIVIV